MKITVESKVLKSQNNNVSGRSILEKTIFCKLNYFSKPCDPSQMLRLIFFQAIVWKVPILLKSVSGGGRRVTNFINVTL